MVEHSPKILAREEKATTITTTKPLSTPLSLRKSIPYSQLRSANPLRRSVEPICIRRVLSTGTCISRLER